MIEVAGELSLPDDEVTIEAVRSQGAGGQNVNKVATAVQLRFDIGASSLPEVLKARLLGRADRRISREGVIIFKVQRHRSQEQNRAEALDKLVAMIQSVLVEPKARRPTRPTTAARRRRLEQKTRRGELKAMRRPPDA